MRNFRNSVLISFLLLCSNFIKAQTTVTSGNWSDPTVWSTVAVPLPSSASVTVNNPLTIDYNDGGGGIDPSAGTWTFNSNATDQPGGTAYQFNPNGGAGVGPTITISAGVTVTFEGTSSISNTTLYVYGTLIVGALTINNTNNPKNNIIIEPGGTLIVNGNFTDNDNTGSFTVNGTMTVNGNFADATGSVTVGGTGAITSTGTMTSTGGSTIQGYTNDCTTGPCSVTNLACSFTNNISPTSKAVCSGSTVSFTGTTNGTSPSYQWQSSTDGSTYSNISGATSSTYTTGSLTTTTWYRLQVTASSCTSQSAATTVTVLSSSGGWIGSTSTDWNTGSNWCSNSVPGSGTDVTISNASGIANMPTIASGTAALCNSLTINSTYPTSTLTIAAASNASLSIYGNFTNSGSFTDNSTSSSAGVKFVGSVAQTIAGTTQNTFNNLTIANTSGATPALNVTTNNIIVNSNLTLTSGMVNLNGYTITLGSGSSSVGTLSYSTNWIYGGNIQRWFPTTSISVGNVAGHFPIGTSTDYRPIFFGNGGLSAAGTIKVSHTGITGSTSVSPTFTDNGGTVVLRSNSYWTVTTANSIGTGTHNIQTQGTGFGTVGAVTDLRQTLANAISPGTDGAHAGTTSNPTVNRTGLSTANLSNSFYWGSINSTNTPLPVNFIDFAGEELNGQTKLIWSTASEQNNDYFSIYHSTDGEKFTDIGQVRGNGTTNDFHEYSMLDVSPAAGRNYYRLSQTDFDGKTSILKTIAVDIKEATVRTTIFPNPIRQTETLTIEVKGLKPNQYIGMQIMSMQGIILTESVNQADEGGDLKIAYKPTTNLATGVYLVKVGALRSKLLVY